ncbi:hypothetical protein H8E77_43800 [bacterium]|nr:hypothetical protein [bacterium]
MAKYLNKNHLLGAIRVSMQQGGNFLVNRISPNGPIMRERNLNYIHKASWGMYAAGVDHSIIARLLDWTLENALQPNGDFYFLEEEPEYKDRQRLYRPLTFGKVAAWIGHPVAKNQQVIDRILQYQHKDSGGVFHYIGDDADKIEEQETIGALNTTFLGHLMIALDMQEQAVKAGEWTCRFVKANRESMLNDGLMYTQTMIDGQIVTNVKEYERISRVVDNKKPKQEFWQVGTAMAYLSVLYDTMRERWSYSEEQALPYLDCALTLLNFEDTMPLETYLWPSKCKVGWGAGELLRVLVKYGNSEQQIEKAYRIAEKVAIFTFLDNQLPNGGWSCMHYPLSELAPEIRFDYKPLKGIVNVPEQQILGSQTIFLPGEEITGEFLGEMKSIERGILESCPIQKICL